LWKSFRTHRENDSGLLQTPFTFSPESPFIFNPGTLFAFAPERFSRSSRNRVHLAPESALSADVDPDRLSFLHTVRVVRRKMAIFGAIPPSGPQRFP
jgi:hypothetical protein